MELSENDEENSSDSSSFKGFPEEDETYEEMELSETDEKSSSDSSSFKGFPEEDEDEVVADDTYKLSAGKFYRKVCMVGASSNNEESEEPDLLLKMFTPDVCNDNETTVRPTQNIELNISDDSQTSNDIDIFLRIMKREIPTTTISAVIDRQNSKGQQRKTIKTNFLSQLQAMMQSNKSKGFFDELEPPKFLNVSVSLAVQQVEISFGVHFITASVIEYNQLCPDWPCGTILRLAIDAEKAEPIKQGSKLLALMDMFSSPYTVLNAQKQSVQIYLQPGQISLLGD